MCGPVVQTFEPDLSIIGTEPDVNVLRLDPNSGFLTEGADLKFKVPQLLVEIIGGKDEWGRHHTYAKTLAQATYSLHFYPAAYFMLIWDTGVAFYRVTREIRNNNSGRLVVHKEWIPFDPDNRPLVTAANPGPASLGGPQLVNNVASPAVTDISAKLQLIAQRVITILIECNRDRQRASVACNDLRALPQNAGGAQNAPSWGPMPSSDMAVQIGRGNFPMGGTEAVGFKPLWDDPAQHPMNPHAVVGNPHQNNPRWGVGGQIFDLPRDKDFPVPYRLVNPVEGCRKCNHANHNLHPNPKNYCMHINDWTDLEIRAQRRAALPFTPYY